MEKDELIQHHRLLLESRENAHIFAFLNKYGVEELVKKTNYDHGFMCGKKALIQSKPVTCDVKTSVEILLKWVVGGLIVEKGLKWVEATENKVVLRVSECAHMAAWKDAGVPTDKACNLYKAWVDGFIHAINPRINHYKNFRISAGDTFCEEVWELREGKE